MENEVTYGVAKVIYSYKGNNIETYGLVAYENFERDGALAVVTSSKNLSNCEEKLQKLAQICNEEKLELIQMNDVFEDFLMTEKQ